jgi:MFS family permease
MAPEQARDASSVDHRADEYSLGCTLYYLVAGKAPYSGSSAFEIISKHQTEPPPPLESYVRNVPPALSDILKRMLAKDPGDRYPTLVEVIRELEAFLGVGAEKGPYTPREHHMAVLETEQKNYDSAPTARMRKLVVAGFAGGISVLILGALFSGYPVLAGGLLGLGLMTPLAGFILDGILHKRHLFRRVRSVFFGMTLRGWAATAGSAAIMLGILYVLGLLWHWLIFAVLAAGLAAAYQLRVVRRLDAERAPAIASTLEMLKQLRLRGVPEEAMQDFVCRFSSEQWEEFFEELFGYEAMVLARGKWAAADKVHPRKKFSTWRDPVARALDGVEQHRKAAREKHQLAKVEAKRLRAQGVTEKEAELQAQEAATKILSDIRITHAAPAKDVPVPKARPRHTSEKTVLDRAFQVARFLLGAAMCVGFAAFLFQNISVAAVRPILQVVNQLPMPEGVMRVLHSYYGLGAGVALILSSFSGRRIGPVLVTAGAVLMVGFQFIVPLISRFHVVTGQAAIYAAVGLIVAGLGWSLLGKLTTGRF